MLVKYATPKLTAIPMNRPNNNKMSPHPNIHSSTTTPWCSKLVGIKFSEATQGFQISLPLPWAKRAVPSSMATGNVELTHKCHPKHLSMVAARMK